MWILWCYKWQMQHTTSVQSHPTYITPETQNVPCKCPISVCSSIIWRLGVQRYVAEAQPWILMNDLAVDDSWFVEQTNARRKKECNVKGRSNKAPAKCIEIPEMKHEAVAPPMVTDMVSSTDGALRHPTFHG